MKLTFKKSDKASFETYKSWFTDTTLNKQLGPMDDETWETWQKYHKIEPSNELAVYLKNELVAVVDISQPSKENLEYCITAIATNPYKKRKGIATAILKFLLESGNFRESNLWVAHVNPENVAAIRFFEKHGWKKRGIEHEMITYEFEQDN